MSDDQRRGRPRPGARPRPSIDDVDADDRGRGGPAARRPGGAARGTGRKKAMPRSEQSGFWGLFSSGRAQHRRRVRQDEFDWAAADDQDDDRPRRRGGRVDDPEAYDEEPAPRDDDYDEYGGAPRRRPRPQGRSERATLMDLASPIFGYAASLPHDPGGVHPGYPQFRQEVMTALQRFQSEAQEHGIDRQDAEDAQFALAAFMDEQVGTSEWSGKTQWQSEPLNMTLLADPEAGVSFFRKLDAFGDRQRAVKEIYLVCLSMGFRGQYAELDPTQQAARLGEIRQKVLRSIHPEPLDSLDVLFPEAYEPAAPIEDEAPPPPKIWVTLSVVAVVVCIGLWIWMYVAAGSLPDDATREMKRLAESSAAEAGR